MYPAMVGPRDGLMGGVRSCGANKWAMNDHGGGLSVSDPRDLVARGERRGGEDHGGERAPWRGPRRRGSTGGRGPRWPGARRSGPARPPRQRRKTSATGPAAPDDGDVGQVDREAAGTLERGHDRGTLVGTDLPGRAAGPAVEVPMLGIREDVVLLAAVRAVAVAHDAQLLEDIERPVDGRGDRRRVMVAAAVDKIGAGHVAVSLRKHRDQGPSLWASSAGPARGGDRGLTPRRRDRLGGFRRVARAGRVARARRAARAEPATQLAACAKYRANSRDTVLLQEVALETLRDYTPHGAPFVCPSAPPAPPASPASTDVHRSSDAHPGWLPEPDRLGRPGRR